jgi:hypothetical protein
VVLAQVTTCDYLVPVKCPEYPVLRGFYGCEEGLSSLNPAEPVGIWRVMISFRAWVSWSGLLFFFR